MNTGRHTFRVWILPMLSVVYVVGVAIGTLHKLVAPVPNPPLWLRAPGWPEIFYGPAITVGAIGFLLWMALWLSDLVLGRGS